MGLKWFELLEMIKEMGEWKIHEILIKKKNIKKLNYPSKVKHTQRVHFGFHVSIETNAPRSL